MEEALKDARFSHILTDPRFRKMPRNVRKVAIDKRFKSMFKDKKFKGKCVLDKRGRPLDLTSTENLKKLYEVSSESSEDEDENDEDHSSNETKEDEGDDNNLQTSNDEQLFETKKNITENLQLSKSKSKVNDIKNENIKSSKEKLKEAITPNKAKSTFKSKNNKKLLSKIQGDFSVDRQNEDATNFDTENLKVKQIETKSPAIRRTEISSSDDEESSTDEVDDAAKDSADEKDSSEESDDSDESDSDDSDEEKDEEFDHQWEELRNEAPDTDEITHRLAVCNMDWDRIRAEDLLACFESFKPADSCINSVKIYPSEYGLKRMEEEKLKGPPELVQESLPLDAEEEEDTKGSKYHREKLRQYQINRLKYYYAVVDCDSPETANTLYEQLNGMEYESSSVTFDLRFIPDDLTFDQEPTSVADKLSNPTEYKPRLFVTTALQQVKVNLTWDETDPKRRETLQKAFTEPADIEKDIHDYLASSSGESEEEEDNPSEEANLKLSTKDRIAKYKELLLSLEEKEKEDENKYEMEITWEPGLKERTEEVVKEKLKKDNLNPFEEKLQKKREERKLKKKQQKMLLHQSDEGSDSAYSDDEFFSKPTSNAKDDDSKRLAELTLISDSKKNLEIDEKPNKKSKKYRLQKKKEKSQKDNFQLDVNDPRFSAIYSSHLFNIDPSDPHYKDTEGNRALIQEKQKKLKMSEFGSSNKNVKKARYS